MPNVVVPVPNWEPRRTSDFLVLRDGRRRGNLLALDIGIFATKEP